MTTFEKRFFKNIWMLFGYVITIASTISLFIIEFIDTFIEQQDIFRLVNLSIITLGSIFWLIGLLICIKDGKTLKEADANSIFLFSQFVFLFLPVALIYLIGFIIDYLIGITIELLLVFLVIAVSSCIISGSLIKKLRKTLYLKIKASEEKED